MILNISNEWLNTLFSFFRSDANDIPWQIHVEGGILGIINKTVKGTIDIPAGDTVTVITGMFLGFGPIFINAKVADEKKAEEIQILIFSIVKKKGILSPTISFFFVFLKVLYQ